MILLKKRNEFAEESNETDLTKRIGKSHLPL